jgi:hypothetical protein
MLRKILDSNYMPFRYFFNMRLLPQPELAGARNGIWLSEADCK